MLLKTGIDVVLWEHVQGLTLRSWDGFWLLCNPELDRWKKMDFPTQVQENIQTLGDALLGFSLMFVNAALKALAWVNWWLRAALPSQVGVFIFVADQCKSVTVINLKVI